jgi:hypothetical protein
LSAGAVDDHRVRDGRRGLSLLPAVCVLALTGCTSLLGGAAPTTSAKVTPLTAGVPTVSANRVSPPQVAPFQPVTSAPATPTGSGPTVTTSPETPANWCYPNGTFSAYYSNGLGVPALTVRPGPGTAEVSWWSTGDPAISAYKVTAVPTWVVEGTQAPLTWTTVAPTLTCRPVAVQLTGLGRNRTYEIWVDVVLRTANPAVGRDVMADRSPVFRTT